MVQDGSASILGRLVHPQYRFGIKNGQFWVQNMLKNDSFQAIFDLFFRQKFLISKKTVFNESELIDKSYETILADSLKNIGFSGKKDPRKLLNVAKLSYSGA